MGFLSVFLCQDFLLSSSCYILFINKGFVNTLSSGPFEEYQSILSIYLINYFVKSINLSAFPSTGIPIADHVSEQFRMKKIMYTGNSYMLIH